MTRAIAVSVALTVCIPIRAAEPPSFPGAEGSGSTTPGGRGGKVLFVTNLDDSGPGSLRAACGAQGPRIVVFRVGGMIRLKSDLVVRNPFLTLTGQSAPGDGICLRDATFGIATHDVIIRYLRSRLGDESRKEGDAFDLLHGTSNAIVDHCSASWSVDECLSLSGNNSHCTVQWCLIGESLNHSIHSKGDHGYGSLARADGPISFHHNLWIHNKARNPRLGDNYGRGSSPRFDVRNNVIYDYGEIASGLTQGKFEANYVANYIRPGPSSTAKYPIRVGGPSELVFFIQGNIFEGNERLTADNSLFFDPVEIDGKRQVRTVAEPVAAPPMKTLPAKEAYEAVLASVGASLPVRDAVDARLVQEVRDRTGAIRNSQNEVGGWPEYRPAEPPQDSDQGGMPDAWETAHGLNINDPSDNLLDRDGDGYTNFEEYLNSLVPP